MNIPILRYLDVLIGLSVVMLMAATVALSISQTLLNSWGARASHLARSLEGVIRQLHPELLKDHAAALSREVLLHPLICRPRSALSRVVTGIANLIATLSFGWLRLPRTWPHVRARVPGGVLLREELVMVLLELAASEADWELEWPSTGDDGKGRRTALRQALAQRGIEDPAATLKAVRLQAMANEQANPEQSAQLWRSQALAQCAPSDFVAGVYQTFDAAMARATTSFGSEAQVCVTIVALAIAVGLQLDAIALVKRLSADDTYRNALVDEGRRINERTFFQSQPDPNDSCAAFGSPESPTAQYTQCQINLELKQLHSPTLQIWPADNKAWTWRSATSWIPEPPTPWTAQSVAGVFIAWLLISLGAPFWFDLLKNLFQLRSVLAQRDQQERTDRQNASPTATLVTKQAGTAAASAAGQPAGAPGQPSGTPPTEPADDGMSGEMGDLAATGAHG